MCAVKWSVRVDHFYSLTSNKDFNRPEEAHCYTMSDCCSWSCVPVGFNACTHKIIDGLWIRQTESMGRGGVNSLNGLNNIEYIKKCVHFNFVFHLMTALNSTTNYYRLSIHSLIVLYAYFWIGMHLFGNNYTDSLKIWPLKHFCKNKSKIKLLLLNCTPNNGQIRLIKGSLFFADVRITDFLSPWPEIFSKFIHVKGHLFGPRPELESISAVAG